MRASLNINPRKTVLHVSGFYQGREGHQPSREKPSASSGRQSEMAVPPENSCPTPLSEKADLETSAAAGNTLNADVPVASRLQIDVEMTTDTLEKAASSSPPAASHHPNKGDVSTKGGESSLGIGELSQKISNPVLDPKYTGTYAEGDPFLVKLQEIDSDLQKFECQNDEIVWLGSDMEQGISKAPNGLDGKGKIGLGPGPQKENKKGQWTRITKGPNYDVGEEVTFGADGLKRKVWETQARDKLNTEKEKKQKTEEVTRKQFSHLTLESTVDFLINSTLGGWNTNLIDLCFYPPEAILIKSLPLCSTPQPDTLVWRPEKSGCYSVKSGYKLLCELPIPDLNRLQVPVSSQGFWKCIWKLNVPGKIKHFLWRACSNSLPTKENLLKRKILQESSCPRCSVASESVVHALWSCDCIRVIWNSDFDWVDRSSMASDSFSDVLQKIRVKPAILSLFATTA
nr:putative ribonuclease h protein [Quercus suber]